MVGERAAAGAVARGRAHAQPYGGRPEPHGEGRRGGTHLQRKAEATEVGGKKGGLEKILNKKVERLERLKRLKG